MTEATEKILLSAEDERLDCWRLAAEIVAKEPPFDVVVGLARGGYRIAHYLQEFFILATRRQVGLATVRCRSYSAVAVADSVQVGSLAEVWTELGDHGDRVLVVDDIFDRGATALAVKNALLAEAPRPLTLKFAMLHYKPENTQVPLEPDFYVRKFRGNQWIVYPCSVSDVAGEWDALRLMGMPENIVQKIQGAYETPMPFTGSK